MLWLSSASPMSTTRVSKSEREAFRASRRPGVKKESDISPPSRATSQAASFSCASANALISKLTEGGSSVSHELYVVICVVTTPTIIMHSFILQFTTVNYDVFPHLFTEIRFLSKPEQAVPVKYLGLDARLSFSVKVMCLGLI